MLIKGECTLNKRILKKRISNISDSELFEHVAYCEGRRMRELAEKEFDKRFKDALEYEEKMAEELMHISFESDELMKSF